MAKKKKADRIAAAKELLGQEEREAQARCAKLYEEFNKRLLKEEGRIMEIVVDIKPMQQPNVARFIPVILFRKVSDG